MLLNALLYGLFMVWLNAKFNAVLQHFDDMDMLDLRADLRRVEKALDARMNRIEGRR
jgi:sensor domain CHASE-containing protein